MNIKMKIETMIQKLVDYAVKNELIFPEDELVVRNQLMDVMGITDWTEAEPIESEDTIDQILDDLVAYAAEQGLISGTNESKDLFDTKIMGVLTALPSQINRMYQEKYAQSPKAATDWYYDWSQKVNYVRAGRIAKDLRWTYESEYGTLDITINRSKPEKDPRDIAAAKNSKAAQYPKCQLCMENAGYAGRIGHPARQNLRVIPLQIQGEAWGLQYSPYGYYNEHCIVLNSKHIPMKIDAAVFKKLLDIIEALPHYFVGSNADLPIVGGSILSHEHFQGGGYTFAMFNSPVEYEFAMADFPAVKAGIVKWPMSVIKLSGTDRCQLEEACAKVLALWRGYSDESVGVYAQTDAPHNTITPIVRKNGEDFECYLVLRNNRTSQERPLGIFHPNPSLHHIKKENIGLIEVMGLAVLPSRLAEELVLLKDAMLSGADLTADAKLAQHAAWAAEVLADHPEFAADNAQNILEQEVGAVFAQVLTDAGVFKRDEAGQEAFKKFVSLL